MNDPISFMASLVSLLFFVVLVFWLYRDYRTDTFRQKLFSLRDELFDEAVSGKIAFDDPAYGMLRSTMNGFIRFAHRINLPQTVFLLVAFKYNRSQLGTQFHRRLEENIRRMPKDQQDMIMSYYVRMNFHMIEHLLLSSPIILLTVIIPVVFLFEAKKHIQGIVGRLRGPLDKVDAAALATGEI